MHKNNYLPVILWMVQYKWRYIEDENANHKGLIVSFYEQSSMQPTIPNKLVLIHRLWQTGRNTWLSFPVPDSTQKYGNLQWDQCSVYSCCTDNNGMMWAANCKCTTVLRVNCSGYKCLFYDLERKIRHSCWQESATNRAAWSKYAL